MTDRPDPDALLAQLRQHDERQRRGRLRIYFGASAGVGKTCAMLAAARQLHAGGTDVLAGVVETHGRGDTAALLDGLPLLAPARLQHRGKLLAEFDLDAALARRPALVLVDELAHSNVAGSRHARRWQDVDELLAAGIDVWSTLNVQHLESLNDIVGGITGVVVHETLPDTFFDRADEVVLVDTPADELIARLAAGKVYLPAQAERAAAHFFRKGNLMALRELALRRTADRVEDDVQAWRSERAIARVWKTEGALLCCIGPDAAGAEHVVRSAAQLARQLAVSWHAVYVETPALQRLPGERRDAVLRTVTLAQQLGAATAVLPARSVAEALVAHARHHNLTTIVLGTARTRRWPRATLRQALAERASDIDRIELAASAQPARAAPAPVKADGEAPAARASRHVLALAACALTTVLSHLLQPFFDATNIAMLFLLAVVGVAARLGRGPAVLAAFVNVAAYDFFFVSPQLSFAVSDAQYLLTFATLLTVGLVVGQLTAGLRFQARVATERESRSRALFEAARDLSNTLTAADAADVAAAVIGRAYDAEVALFVLDAADVLRPPQPLPAGADAGSAQWAFDHGQPAGLSTDTLAGSAWLYLPLKATMRTRGVLAIRPAEPRLLRVPEQRQQLETFAALAAMALERVHYVEVARAATVQMESERLRNSLLAALSHDLRTPLASQVALAETLRCSQPTLAPEQQALAQALADKALRTADMVTNLLEMARIQSGAVRLHAEWQSVEEIVGGAVKAAEPLLDGRALAIRIDPALPLVRCDAVLVERVLVNLLENACKYTPAGSPLAIDARVADGSRLRLALVDHGPGVAPGQEDAIFDTFTRGDAESATPGVGLGLAICRAIVQAHGGRIGVERTDPHGATFVVELPLGAPPPAPEGDAG